MAPLASLWFASLSGSDWLWERSSDSLPQFFSYARNVRISFYYILQSLASNALSYSIDLLLSPKIASYYYLKGLARSHYCFEPWSCANSWSILIGWSRRCALQHVLPPHHQPSFAKYYCPNFHLWIWVGIMRNLAANWVLNLWKAETPFIDHLIGHCGPSYSSSAEGAWIVVISVQLISLVRWAK
jgi:hypothetical protein